MFIFSMGRKCEKLPNRFLANSGWVKTGASSHAQRSSSCQKVMDSFEACVQEYEASLDNKAKAAENILTNIASNYGLSGVSKAIESGENPIKAFQKLGVLKSSSGRVIINGPELAQEITNMIKSFPATLKGLKEFLPHMKDMPERHINLAHDIIDAETANFLSNRFIFPTVELNKINSQGESFLQYIFSILPTLSKENPEALDLLEKVMTHSDVANAKFFINEFFKNLPPLSKMGKQMKETEGLVQDIAECTLKGMPSMDLGPNCKEGQFFNTIMRFCSPETKPENLKILKQTGKTADTYKIQSIIDTEEILEGNTEIMQRNLELLPKVLENAESQGIKEIEVSGFLTKNINLD